MIEGEKSAGCANFSQISQNCADFSYIKIDKSRDLVPKSINCRIFSTNIARLWGHLPQSSQNFLILAKILPAGADIDEKIVRSHWFFLPKDWSVAWYVPQRWKNLGTFTQRSQNCMIEKRLSFCRKVDKSHIFLQKSVEISECLPHRSPDHSANNRNNL